MLISSHCGEKQDLLNHMQVKVEYIHKEKPRMNKRLDAQNSVHQLIIEGQQGGYSLFCFSACSKNAYVE